MDGEGGVAAAIPRAHHFQQDRSLATQPPVDDNRPSGRPPTDRDIAPISIVEEMKTSYLDYAMSVIVSRALPDVRDGLKPVHRRILYACQEAGYVAGRPYRKSSRIVGDVMGKYHPHGDSAIYDALARMTQDWSMRVPLIDGQGNFGSMDPDPPAAMRYTEARLAKVANFLLGDIDKDTVDFHAELRRFGKRAAGAPCPLPQPAGQRRRRDRGRHGDQHPAAQSRRSARRLPRLHGRPGDQLRSADGACEGPGFPDRRLHPWPVGHPQRLHDGPRLDHASLAPPR